MSGKSVDLQPDSACQSPVVPRGFEKRQEVDPAWPPAPALNAANADDLTGGTELPSCALAIAGQADPAAGLRFIGN